MADDQYTTQAPDWNSWVDQGDTHPPAPMAAETNPLALEAERRRKAQEALAAQQQQQPQGAAPLPLQDAQGGFNGPQEGQVVQPPPAGTAVEPQGLPTPPIPPKQDASPVASALSAPTQGSDTPLPTPPIPPAQGSGGANAPVNPSSGSPPAPMPPSPVGQGQQPTSPIAAAIPAGAPSPGAAVPSGQSLPRGLRNNNPLNLEYRPDQGAVGSDGRFGVYPTMEAGVAAAQKQLLRYQDDRGLNTVASIVGRWSPTSDPGNAPGSTSAYAATVAKSMGVGVNDPIDLHKPETMNALVSGMSAVENGTTRMVGPGPLTGGSGQTGVAGSPGPAGQPGAATAPVTPASTGGVAARQAEMDAILSGNNLPYNAKDIERGRFSDKMFALAGGLLSGKGPADAFGKGFSALAASGQSERSDMMKLNAEQRQMNALGIRSNYQAGQLGVAGSKVVQGDQRLQQGDRRLTLAEQTQAWKESPEGKAAMDQAAAEHKTLSSATIKDNYKDAKEIDEAGINANKNLPAMQGLLEQVDKSGAGPGVVSAFKRRIAQALDVPIGDTDPTAIQLTNAYASMGQSQAAQAMKGLGLRTQNEFNTFIKGVGTIDNDPSVIKTLIGQVARRAQSDAQMYADYNAMTPEDKAHMMTTTSGVSGFRSKYVQETGAEQGVRTTGGGGNASAPTTQPAQGSGTVQMTGPDGKVWSVPPEKVQLFRSNGYK